MGKRNQIENAFERIKSRLLSLGISLGDGGDTVLTLISRLRGEGVTTIAIGFAAEMAKDGEENTLLIDASSEGKRVANTLNINITPLSLEDIEKGDVDIKDFIEHLNDLDLDILSLSMNNSENSNFIGFNNEFWSKIRSRYKFIIVDAGSCQKALPRFWANWADHTALVLDPALTNVDIFKRFNGDLDRFGIKLSGFIMNKRTFHIPKFLYNLVY